MLVGVLDSYIISLLLEASPILNIDLNLMFVVLLCDPFRFCSICNMALAILLKKGVKGFHDGTLWNR
jgi:hypothetical protein